MNLLQILYFIKSSKLEGNLKVSYFWEQNRLWIQLLFLLLYFILFLFLFLSFVVVFCCCSIRFFHYSMFIKNCCCSFIILVWSLRCLSYVCLCYYMEYLTFWSAALMLLICCESDFIGLWNNFFISLLYLFIFMG